MSMNNMSIKEILKGCEPGRLQSVGYMQIIPLTSTLVDDSIAPPNLLSSTKDYGHLVVENPSDKPTILPFGANFISEQAAQNHAATKTAIVNAKTKQSILTAACTQQSQGGTINHGKHQMSILPWFIKEAAMLCKDVKSYGKLWPTITEFNQNLGLQNRGHLEDYLKGFEKELNTFIAEFEIIPNQVGAIILINGYVMGIERAPNYAYWSKVWKPLIRESYGSLVLQYRRLMGKKAPAPKTRVPLKSGNIKSIKDIRDALTAAENQEESNARQVVRTFIKDRFSKKVEEKMGSMVVESVTHKQLTGQIVRDDERILYASLTTTGDWVKNQEWNETDSFKI